MIGPGFPRYSSDMYEAMVIRFIFAVTFAVGFPSVVLGFLLWHRARRMSQLFGITGLLVIAGSIAWLGLFGPL